MDLKAVLEFRAYIVYVHGHYAGVHQIIALTRDEAIAAAIRLVDGHALELWTGAELIGTLTPSHFGSGPTVTANSTIRGVNCYLAPLPASANSLAATLDWRGSIG